MNDSAKVDGPGWLIRRMAPLDWDERIELLVAIADNPESKVSDRIDAIDLLGHYGEVGGLPLPEDEPWSSSGAEPRRT